MIDFLKYIFGFLLFQCVLSLTVKKEDSIVNHNDLSAAYDDCDPSTIPVMASFDMKKFTGKWFELAKTATGYLDTADGVWLIEGNNQSHNFLFSGRDNNRHCIRPIKGKISAAHVPPGMLTLQYKTYSTNVEEVVRVLFTDYTSIAVVYSCIHHVHTDKEVCHTAGLFGAIWTREEHVGVEVYDTAAKYLEMACIHKHSLIVRNLIGPCRVDNWDFRIDDFPAPDYCYQIMDLGSCQGNLQRYYYDAKEKICKQFTYGGCGGNKNNFLSLSECQKKCAISPNEDPVCMSTAKCALHCSPCCTEDNIGCVQCDCEHVIEDNVHNCVSSPSQCPDECDVEHLYLGCHVCKCGGNNNLDDFGICNEVKEEGNCKDRIDRYFYNVEAEQCEKFTYSGCGGNNNNFQTLQECREACHRPISDIVIEHGPLGGDWDDSTASSLKAFLSHTVTAILIIIFHFTYCFH